MRVNIIHHRNSWRTDLESLPDGMLKRAASGLRVLGHDVTVNAYPQMFRDGLSMCWGWRTGKKLVDAGCKTVILERGYIGDRFHYTSVGLNGLNGYAEFPEYPDDDGARFREHGGVIEPWREDGDYIVLLGQVHGDQSLQGRNLLGWYAQMAEKAARYYGKPVFYRRHPLNRGHYQKVNGVPSQSSQCTLAESLEGAMLAITWNSNSALDAVLAGVPVIAGDRGTMAWDLCMRDVGEIERPSREAVAHRIAWAQWAPEELESGAAFRSIVEEACAGFA